jgi:hypothetical protein
MKVTNHSGVRRLELRPHQTLSLDAGPGTIVRALQGTIWLTQEGLLSDYVLIPGTRFVAESKGKIVVNSMDGVSAVRIYEPGCSGRREYGHGLQVDSGVIARVEREARRARAKEIRRMAGKLGAFIATAWRSLARRFGEAVAQH